MVANKGQTMKKSILLVVFLLSITVISYQNCGGGGGKKDGGSNPPCTDCGDINLPQNSVYLVSYQERLSLSTADIQSEYSHPQFQDAIQYAVKGYRVVYKTKDPNGSDINVSGALLMPVNSLNNPILSMHHYTIFEESYIPSYMTSNNFIWEEPVIAASGGYIVFVADYIGYGESQHLQHPYSHSQMLATTAIDGIRAAKEFITSTGLVKTNNKLFLAGESEGALTTVAVHKMIQEKFSSEFDLRASSALAGTYHFSKQVEAFLENPNSEIESPATVAFTILGFNYAEGWGDADSFFFSDDDYQLIQGGAFNGDYTWNQLNSVFNDTANSLLSPAFINAYRTDSETKYRDSFESTDVHEWLPERPILLFHGTADQTVLSFHSQDFYDYATARGNRNITLRLIPGGTHFNLQDQWDLEMMTFFESHK
jgi:hypothetical protein